MAKKKKHPQSSDKTGKPADSVKNDPAPVDEKSKKKKPRRKRGDGIRETIESVVVAFILAFLFRTFEAEAFVIPTGSMAPTLRGEHLLARGPQTGYEFAVGPRDVSTLGGAAQIQGAPDDQIRIADPMIEREPTGGDSSASFWDKRGH